jgi:hypothetical protein
MVMSAASLPIRDDQTITRFDGWSVSRFYGDILIAI